jgi:hypothetical protein
MSVGDSNTPEAEVGDSLVEVDRGPIKPDVKAYEEAVALVPPEAKAFRLKPGEKNPDGYLFVAWHQQPFPGNYAVKPKQGCPSCHGVGVIRYVHKDEAQEKACNCIIRRLKLFLDEDARGPDKPARAHDTAPKIKIPDTSSLEVAIQNVEREIERRAEKVKEYEAEHQELVEGRREACTNCFAALKERNDAYSLRLQELHSVRKQREALLETQRKQEAKAEILALEVTELQKTAAMARDALEEAENKQSKASRKERDKLEKAKTRLQRLKLRMKRRSKR